MRLALGDIKALLMHVAGKQVTEDIFVVANLRLAATGNSVGIGLHRNNIWAEVRKQFPEKMDPPSWKMNY